MPRNRTATVKDETLDTMISNLNRISAPFFPTHSSNGARQWKVGSQRLGIRQLRNTAALDKANNQKGRNQDLEVRLMELRREDSILKDELNKFNDNKAHSENKSHDYLATPMMTKWA